MKISKAEKDGVFIFNISGRLDASNSQEAETELNAIERDGLKVLLNMEDLEYISSSGLRVILLTAKKIRAAHGRLCLASLTESVMDVFEISGFVSIFDIADSETDGMAILMD